MHMLLLTIEKLSFLRPTSVAVEECATSENALRKDALFEPLRVTAQPRPHIRVDVTHPPDCEALPDTWFCEMRKPSTWGDGNTPLGSALLLRSRIVVYTTQPLKPLLQKLLLKRRLLEKCM